MVSSRHVVTKLYLGNIELKARKLFSAHCLGSFYSQGQRIIELTRPDGLVTCSTAVINLVLFKWNNTITEQELFHVRTELSVSFLVFVCLSWIYGRVCPRGNVCGVQFTLFTT